MRVQQLTPLVALIAGVLARVANAYVWGRKYMMTTISVAIVVAPWAYAAEPIFIAPGILVGLIFGWYYTTISGAGMGSTLGALMGLYAGPLIGILLPFSSSLGMYILLCFLFGIVFGVELRLLVNLYPAFPILRITTKDGQGRTVMAFRFASFLALFQLITVMLYVGVGIPIYIIWILSPYSGFWTSVPDWSHEFWLIVGIGLPAWFGLLLGWVAFSVGSMTGTVLARGLALELSPAIKFFRMLLPWLRTMRAGLLSFAVGYLVTIFCFAGFYAALYRNDPKFFSGVPISQGRHLWDFLFFSVTTITTIGLSEIRPAQDYFLSRAMVTLELLAGVFWIVIYFAVLMSSLQIVAGQMVAKPRHRKWLSPLVRKREKNSPQTPVFRSRKRTPKRT